MIPASEKPTLDLREFVEGPQPIPPDMKLKRKVAEPDISDDYFRQNVDKPVREPLPETKNPILPSERWSDSEVIAMKHVPANPGGEDRSEFQTGPFQDDREFHESMAKIALFNDLPPLHDLDTTVTKTMVWETEEPTPKKIPTATELPQLFDRDGSESRNDLDHVSAEFDNILDSMRESFSLRGISYLTDTKITPEEKPSMQTDLSFPVLIPPQKKRVRLPYPGIRFFKPLPPRREAPPFIETQSGMPERSTDEMAEATPSSGVPRNEPGDVVLVTEALTKSYYKGKLQIPVLKGVDFSVREKEFVAIVGQSGSGKSTLLHLLGTLDNPESGAILFNGKRIDNLPIAKRDRLRNRNIGLIFQFYHLLPELTTLENVLSPLMIRESVFGYFARRRGYIAAAKELLERVGLSHRLNHKPSELSGGEMQRAAIARALVTQPRILLADEPTGNLDAQSAREIIDLLRQLNREHDLTIVMVTHDLNVAKAADRTVHMIDGIIG